ncbi:TetR/AcrR family transcriptional regulator [Burkholderia plantarii]|uniref:Transcriptional regulator, TetR family n=1 Tax=Burkholderia plantarii TaxID=41899 RepID=A0A0B6S3X8_BURPL|nr:TetR/AcrR family transcriptional regulator [Burkholderia plantarii]AJK46921.1 transcriptional regulator, TetR family [Burkholderia plantarii]ALK31100.1 TetR family transcriptional regulator [Burkholderia plantarii]WLE59746.1 TetR/AcrR family transcriptional regulator [Burkholderia plantarii]GLZ17274.1 TetR family transcriptional regulator [Burkholderia plantarii]
MVRPREFDRDEVLDRALRVFWEKGYAATSTDDLLGAMNIGRQSLYNTFGDKRGLYLEALQRYSLNSVSTHIARLRGAASPLAGIEALLSGLIEDGCSGQALGCMGVNAICEFGTSDAGLRALGERVAPVLERALAEAIDDGQRRGEIDPALDARAAAGFVQIAMQGLQVAARAGTAAEALHGIAGFTVERLRA